MAPEYMNKKAVSKRAGSRSKRYRTEKIRVVKPTPKRKLASHSSSTGYGMDGVSATVL
jgi:hypothetical protein